MIWSQLDRSFHWLNWWNSRLNKLWNRDGRQHGGRYDLQLGLCNASCFVFCSLLLLGYHRALLLRWGWSVLVFGEKNLRANLFSRALKVWVPVVIRELLLYIPVKSPMLTHFSGYRPWERVESTRTESISFDLTSSPTLSSTLLMKAFHFKNSWVGW